MKTKRRLFLFPILLMATFVFLTTGCSDDDDNAKPYSEKDIIGEWHGEPNSSGDIEALKFNDDGSSWFGLFSEENTEISWLTKNDTWKLDGDVVVTEDESGFVLEYEVKMEDTLMALVEKEEGTLFSRADANNGEDDSEEYTMETMSGTFKNVAERIKVELSDDGSAILTKIEGDMTGQNGEVDDGATWEIKEYEAPAGVSSEDKPLSVVIDHSNSEFDEPYVLIIESIDELKDHWQKTISRVDNDGGDNNGVYELGDTGPAGGLVFYVDENNEFDWTYMEAWVDNMGEDYGAWHVDQLSHTSGTSTDLGTGQANTDAMTGSDHEAAEVIRNAGYGGFDDWFLPSRDELLLVYKNLPSVESTSPYWSSSEAEGDDDANGEGHYTGHGHDYGAWRVRLNDNRNYHFVNYRKSGQAHVLGVRTF